MLTKDEIDNVLLDVSYGMYTRRVKVRTSPALADERTEVYGIVCRTKTSAGGFVTELVLIPSDGPLAIQENVDCAFVTGLDRSEYGKRFDSNYVTFVELRYPF